MEDPLSALLELKYEYQEDDTLGFGKYKGVLVSEVLANDPRYLGWLESQDIIKCGADLSLAIEESCPDSWDLDYYEDFDPEIF